MVLEEAGEADENRHTWHWGICKIHIEHPKAQESNPEPLNRRAALVEHHQQVFELHY